MKTAEIAFDVAKLKNDYLLLLFVVITIQKKVELYAGTWNCGQLRNILIDRVRVEQ